MCFSDEGYKADHTEFIIRGTIAGVLLISSVLFSVIALRGHWVRCGGLTYYEMGCCKIKHFSIASVALLGNNIKCLFDILRSIQKNHK